MSSPFAIAAVTAVLRDLLNNGLIDHDLTSQVVVSTSPPDRITTGEEEKSQLNLFMYHVTPNQGWRNVALPSRGNTGERLTNPPLAIDLHYLVTAYGAQDFHAEALLGYAMHKLHETPVLTRSAINKTLKPALPNEVELPPGLESLTTTDLAEQIEQIKITPQFLNTEEISKLWTAFQAKYRPTAAYQVSVLLIESKHPTKTPLPVLKQGEEDSGPAAQSDLIPPFPTLEAVEPPNRQISLRLGETLTLRGHHLAGDVMTARLSHPRLTAPHEISILPADVTADSVALTIPDESKKYPAGFWTLALHIAPAGQPEAARTTNELPLLIAPQITTLPPTIPLPAAGSPPVEITRSNVVNGLGEATIKLECKPHARPEQRLSLVLGEREVLAPSVTTTTNQLSFTFTKLAAGTYRLRLRVDGVDSLLLDRSDSKKPRFDETQKVTIK